MGNNYKAFLEEEVLITPSALIHLLTSHRRRDKQVRGPRRKKGQQQKADEHLEAMKTCRMHGPTLSPEPAVFTELFRAF